MDVTREDVIEKFPNIKMLPIIVVNGDPLGSVEELKLLADNGQLQLLV